MSSAKTRRNEVGSWVWSHTIAHEPLADAGDFEAGQAIMADAGAPGATAARRTSGSLTPTSCADGCTAGTRAPDARASTATRFPITCAARACPVDLRGHVGHPGNVYLREADLLPAIDGWLLVILAPHRIEQTTRKMERAKEAGPAGLARPGSPRPRWTPRPSSPTGAPGPRQGHRPPPHQGHLPARRQQTPGRRNDQPGEVCKAAGAIWGHGSGPPRGT